MTRMPVHRRDFFGDLGNQSENSERCKSSHERVSGEPSHGVGLVFPILRILSSTAPPFFERRAVREALDNPGVDPRLTSKSLAASRMLRVLVEVFQSFLSGGLVSVAAGVDLPCTDSTHPTQA